MKLIIQLFVLFFCAGFISSCLKCKDVNYCPISEYSEKYFSPFNESSYWTYTNGDESLKDSIFISEYSSKKRSSFKPECNQYDEISFNLNSTYYSKETLPGGRKNISCDSLIFFILPDSTFPQSKISLSSNNKTIFSTEGAFNSEITLTVLGEDVDDIICVNNRVWIAPNIGIVQYVAINGTDTFFIKSYSIK